MSRRRASRMERPTGHAWEGTRVRARAAAAADGEGPPWRRPLLAPRRQPSTNWQSGTGCRPPRRQRTRANTRSLPTSSKRRGWRSRPAARAESADRQARPGRSGYPAEAAARIEQANADNNGLKVELAQAHGTVALADKARAEAAERLLEEARADVRIERERYDARLAQLHDQVTRLAARRSPKRATPTKIGDPAAQPPAIPQTGAGS